MAASELALVEKILAGFTCPEIKLEEDLEMERSDDLLGWGGYGEVYPAKYKRGGDLKVAVKMFERCKLTKDQKEEIIACKEARVMCYMKHESIVTIYGLLMHNASRTFAIVMEYMEHKSLHDLCKKLKWELPDCLKMDMMKDIGQAVCYLHRKEPKKLQLIHRDIKLANVLVNKRFKAKLGDFGISQLQGFTTSITGTRPKGSPPYMAPELYNTELVGGGMPKNSCETDVWSFGITLHELLCKGETPFQDVPEDLMRHEIGKGIQSNCMAKMSDCLPKILKDIALECMEQLPEDRPTFENIAKRLQDSYDRTYEDKHRDAVQRVNSQLYEQRTGHTTQDEPDFIHGETYAAAPLRQPSDAHKTSVDEVTYALGEVSVRESDKDKIIRLLEEKNQAEKEKNKMELQRLQEQKNKMESELRVAKSINQAAQSTAKFNYSAKQRSLVDNLVHFQNNLIPESIYDYFIQEGIMTYDNKEHLVKSGVTTRGQASLFLEFILTKDDRAINVLCQALRKECQGFLADKIQWSGTPDKHVTK